MYQVFQYKIYSVFVVVDQTYSQGKLLAFLVSLHLPKLQQHETGLVFLSVVADPLKTLQFHQYDVPALSLIHI